MSDSDDDAPEHREDISPSPTTEDFSSTDNLLTPHPDYDSDEETITPHTMTTSGQGQVSDRVGGSDQIRGSSAIPMYPVNSPRGPSLTGTEREGNCWLGRVVGWVCCGGCARVWGCGCAGCAGGGGESEEEVGT